MLEKIFLFIYVVTVPILSLSNRFGSTFSDYYLAKQFFHIIHDDTISSITTVSQIADWITNDLVPSYFTDKITINKPLFPIYLLKSQIQCNGEAADSLSSECSFIVENLQNNIDKSKIIKNVEGHYGTYPISEYVSIPRDINSTGLTALNADLKADYLDDYSTFLSVEMISYNDWNQAYIEFVVSFEWNAPEQIVAKNIAYDVSSPGSMSGPLFVTFYSLFTIQLIVFIMKVLFEFSMAPNMYTFAGHVAHFTVQAVFTLIVAITLQQDQVRIGYVDSLSAFMDVESSIRSMTYANMLLNLVIIFYPFRLFTLLAWNKHLAIPIKLFVVLYRTLPGVILTGLGFMILWVCFGLASFIGLREFLFQVQSYPSSFLNYFSLDYGKVANDDILGSSKKTQFQLIWAIQNLALVVLVLFAISILVDLVRKSFDHELPAELPQQTEISEKRAEFAAKFDKLLKEMKIIVDSKYKDNKNANSVGSDEKIVIWLEHKMGGDSEGDEVTEHLSKEPIKLYVFYTPEEVEDFLKVLFSLKPNLLTSQSGSKFRIVYETKFEKVNTEKHNIETLLDWLKGEGCRVPFLLFTKAELERETYIHMKKKYPAMFATEDKAGALKFCRMEGKLENLGFRLENNDNKNSVLEDSVSDISGMTSRSSLD